MFDSDSSKNAKYAEVLDGQIRDLNAGRKTRIVHVCGTHEDTISQHGIRSILPEDIELVAGPGCPVCVCAAEDVDMAIELAKSGHIITTFGDMIRVPSTSSSLAKEKSIGADVRVVYGVNEAIEIARRNPDQEVIFVGVGFETTAPTFALELLRTPPANFTLLTSLKIVPPAMEILVDIEGFAVDGFITPGHVSAIIGTDAYKPFVEAHGVPCVAAGFEPLDVLEGIRMLLLQIKEGRAESENQYTRVVKPEGNLIAQKIMDDVFKVDNAPWRGLGIIPESGLYLRDDFKEYDTRERFDIPIAESIDILPGCRCHEVILGIANPTQCPLFNKRCVPENPYGPCMVGHEGTCRIRHANLGI
ncbi:MAG: hydrogenase formation protein HypD [Candidatus Thorarchaeota archaeon]